MITLVKTLQSVNKASTGVTSALAVNIIVHKS